LLLLLGIVLSITLLLLVVVLVDILAPVAELQVVCVLQLPQLVVGDL
jgi:hypothetical protein